MSMRLSSGTSEKNKFSLFSFIIVTLSYRVESYSKDLFEKWIEV